MVGARPAAQPRVLRVHRDAEAEDAGAVRRADHRSGGRAGAGAVSPVLDAAGDRRGLHPGRARELHDVRHVLKLSTDVPDDREVPVGRMAAVIKKFVSLHATNLDQKAEIIVEHFREHVRHRIGGRAKAMVVTEVAAARAALPPGADAATSTSTATAPGRTPCGRWSRSAARSTWTGVVYTEAMVNGFPESQLPKRFESDDYQVLVVAEKYQTGFDQPLLHTMYVDKELGGVAAVQTLSRLNRIHPDKSDTFVLDFENSVEEIETAFAPVLHPHHRDPDRPEPAVRPAAPHRGRVGHRSRRDAHGGHGAARRQVARPGRGVCGTASRR